MHQPYLQAFNKMKKKHVVLALVRRDSGFEYSDDTTPENIFIYEVLKNFEI